MARLDGKAALVTGSGRGIGRAIALKLASEGARLVINDLDREPAEQTVTDIKTAGGEAVACVGSVTAPDFAERFIKTAVETYKVSTSSSTTPDTWDNVIQKMTDERVVCDPRLPPDRAVSHPARGAPVIGRSAKPKQRPAARCTARS
jgi:3-oxoacyl-[acyl-carrier protein] reductase